MGGGSKHSSGMGLSGRQRSVVSLEDTDGVARIPQSETVAVLIILTQGLALNFKAARLGDGGTRDS